MKSRVLTAAVVLVAMAVLSAAAHAQEETLVSIGGFDRTTNGKAKLPASASGAEVYSVTCDQSEDVDGCSDSDGNVWDFGADAHLDKWIAICEEGAPLTNLGGCAHTIEITFKTAQPYMDVFIEFQRAGCEINEIVFNSNKTGGVAGSGIGASGIAVEENEFMDISFGVGMVTPKKDHTLIITSPDSNCPGNSNAITGIAIVGIPISKH